MVRRGLVESRARAQALIDDGRVLVGGAPALRAGRMVDPAEAVTLTGPPPRFVGRGGEKLDAALTRFAIDPGGLTALDAGSSTGGFTDCLLQRGASRVVAVDVGRNQLHERLRADRRVVSLERTNVRYLAPGDLPDGPFPLLVADLSFISLRTVAPALAGLMAPGADAVVLVKPQFEAGRREVSAGRGVIRDPEVWRRVLREVASAWESHGATMMGVMVSPIRGADGNVEFLAHLRPGAPSIADGDLDAVVDDTRAPAGG